MYFHTSSCKEELNNFFYKVTGMPHKDSVFFIWNMQMAAIKYSGDLHKAPSGTVHYTLMEPELNFKSPTCLCLTAWSKPRTKPCNADSFPW